MVPFYANSKKFDGDGDVDPEQVVDKPEPGTDKKEVVHDVAYDEPS